MHPAAEWASITGSWDYQYGRGQPGLWDESPATGSLPGPVAVLLASVLGAFTRTPAICWFAVWEGGGALGPKLQEAPWFSIPGRGMFLLRGEVEAASVSPYASQGDSVVLWWPKDQAWSVGTDIDLVTAYVGGTERYIRQLLKKESLEVMPVSADQRATWDADKLNPLLRRHRVCIALGEEQP
jgi:hypothetical protein